MLFFCPRTARVHYLLSLHGKTPSISFKASPFVFHGRNISRLWNDMRVSKWWGLVNNSVPLNLKTCLVPLHLWPWPRAVNFTLRCQNQDCGQKRGDWLWSDAQIPSETHSHTNTLLQCPACCRERFWPPERAERDGWRQEPDRG